MAVDAERKRRIVNAAFRAILRGEFNAPEVIAVKQGIAGTRDEYHELMDALSRTPRPHPFE